jgi:molecular chaperone DnaK
MSETIVGIDLGTTYSVVAHLDANSRAVSVPNSEGDITTPSVVFLDPNGFVVGKEAIKASEFEPGNVAFHPKRAMGLSCFPTPVRGEQWSPEVLQATILRKLKLDAELMLGSLSRAVVTVPAYFNEPRRKATQDAGQIAGWEVVEILNEPTAAAIAYGVQSGFLQSGSTLQPETILVYDLGGGTFDVTLMRIEGRQFRVLATAGDVQLGGIDWDQRIVDLIATQCLQEHDVDPRGDPASLQRLRIEVEAAKRSLTARSNTTVAITCGDIRVRIPLSREQLEEMTGDLVDRTRFTVRRLVKDAKLTYADLTRILLVGGSTRMPMIPAMLEEETGKAPDRSLSPDEAVAHGAAIYANALMGRFGENQFEIINVNAHDLGILGVEKSTGMPRRRVMIPRNSPLPAESSQQFATRREGQRSALLKIVEGGDDSGNGSTAIGKCVVRDPFGGTAVGRSVQVTFRYAPNGRLEILARSEAGQIASLLIERAIGMPESELETWTQKVQSGLLAPASAPQPEAVAPSEIVEETEPASKAEDDEGQADLTQFQFG